MLPDGVRVFEDVLPDVTAYRAAALAQAFRSVDLGHVTFHGIAEPPSLDLPAWVAAQLPDLAPVHLTFLRRSPAGQLEPNYVHSDADMGTWTGILYLTEPPDPEDGTVFYRDRVTGAEVSNGPDVETWRDRARWEPIGHVAARLNRLLIFPSARYHSRAIETNYGTTPETARLIQVMFGGAPTWQ